MKLPDGIGESIPGKPAVHRAAVRAELHAAALSAAAGAYCRYSGLGVGAAGIACRPDGTAQRIVTGSNVENASYGLTLCAECALVCDLVRTGGGRLLEVVVVDRTGRVLSPCGRCRQVLAEHGGPELLVATPSGPVPMAELLPDAFGPEDLP